MEFKLHWPTVLRENCLDYYVGTQNERPKMKGHLFEVIYKLFSNQITHN